VKDLYPSLYSLSRRKQRGDLKKHKILRNIEDIDYRKFFIRADTVHLRGHNYKLYKNRSQKQCRICFISQRVVNCWNLLPQDVVDLPSLEVFKNRLDKFSLLSRCNLMMMMVTEHQLDEGFLKMSLTGPYPPPGGIRPTVWRVCLADALVQFSINNSKKFLNWLKTSCVWFPMETVATWHTRTANLWAD